MIRNDFRNASYIPEEGLTATHKKILEIIAKSQAYSNNQLAKEMGKSPSTISYHLCNLYHSGYITKHFDGRNNYYELKPKGINISRGVSNSVEVIDRAHDILFIWKITSLPEKGFEEGSFIVNSNMKNWKYNQLTGEITDGIIIQINNRKSMTIVVKEVFASEPAVAVYKAFSIACDYLRTMQSRNRGFFVGRPERFTVLKKQSHAIQKDAFAELCHGKIHVKSTDAKGRFEVDASHGLPEIEFVNVKYAQDDYVRYRDFVLSVINDKFNPWDILNRLEILEKKLLN